MWPVPREGGGLSALSLAMCSVESDGRESSTASVAGDASASTRGGELACATLCRYTLACFECLP